MTQYWIEQNIIEQYIQINTHIYLYIHAYFSVGLLHLHVAFESNMLEMQDM